MFSKIIIPGKADAASCRLTIDLVTDPSDKAWLLLIATLDNGTSFGKHESMADSKKNK